MAAIAASASAGGGCSYGSSRRTAVRRTLRQTDALRAVVTSPCHLPLHLLFSVIQADVIKTRVMNDSQRLYRSPLDCIMKTLRNEGPKAFSMLHRDARGDAHHDIDQAMQSA